MGGFVVKKAGGVSAPTTYADLVAAGATVEAFWDAGDEDSWPGSGTTYSDLTANNIDLTLGNGSTADTMPMFLLFTGDPRNLIIANGAEPSYLRAASNNTFFNSLHKDSALFSAGFMIARMTDNGMRMGGTAAAGTSEIGVLFSVNSAGTVSLSVTTGSGSALSETSTATPLATERSLQFIGISVNEATGAGRWWHNGAELETFTSTYTTPSASNATNPITLFCDGALTGIAGILIGGPMFFCSNYMTDDQWLAVYNSLVARGMLS